MGQLIAAGCQAPPLTEVDVEQAVHAHAQEAPDLSEDDNVKLLKALQQGLVCASPSPEECRKLVSVSRFLTYAQGENVCRQGDPASHFFVVHSGVVSIVRDSREVNSLQTGDCFGEVALIHNCPRNATVKVCSAVATLWAVARSDFARVLQKQDSEQREELGNALNGVALFAALAAEQRTLLQDAAELKHWRKGENVFSKGDEGSCLYVVKKGRLAVLEAGKNNKCHEIIAGDCFGERALLGDGRRTATLEAVATCEIWCLTTDALEAALGGDLRELLRRNLIINAISESETLSQLSARQRKAAGAVFQIRKYLSGTVLNSEGRLFVVLEGSVVVSRDGHQLELGYGRSFGDRSLLESPGSKKEILVAGPKGCEMAELSRDALTRSLRFTSHGVLHGGLEEAITLNRKVDAVRKIYIFRHLSEQQINLLVHAFEEQTFDQGEEVVRQGDAGTHFFMIVQGEVSVKRDGQAMRTLVSNDYFGERALLLDERRSASIQVLSDQAELWAVKKETFLMVIQGSKMESYLRYRIQLQNANIKFSDLQVGEVLGTGGFGEVKLVEHKTTGTLYSLKSIEIQKVEEAGQIDALEYEREILADNDHPFILRLVTTYRDQKYMQFLTELVTGGELYDALQEVPGCLDASQARFYTGSILLALENLQERSIIFRDLKPENVMLDSQGYIKLIDFGCAKKSACRTYTVVGTPHYMAPEMIKTKGYTGTVDIWSLGVCLYEFVCGSLPFGNSCQDNMDVFRAIMKAPLQFTEESSIDADVLDLLQRLLVKSPAQRIGKGIGLDEIKRHSFFADVVSATPDCSPQSRNAIRALTDQGLGSTFFDRLLGREIEPPLQPRRVRRRVPAPAPSGGWLWCQCPNGQLMDSLKDECRLPDPVLATTEENHER